MIAKGGLFRRRRRRFISFRVYFTQVVEAAVQIARLRDVARLFALHRRLHRLVMILILPSILRFYPPPLHLR